ncbi:PREDICTED: chromosome alignment-maintaining phosphoprotein 1 isoform X2 [Chinchilla lanigera]|uniref:Chromosome alignment-maintaining phosphoprotein 1 n=2 Tax=Chinchilla lanigera TaxID=34839 RepID=A0A8C2YV40_CHILA|nr:PREDICTED: chromosome alignment-maintaining phosphoprotein 1 isoform X2 [Chinchilla lanigera]
MEVFHELRRPSVRLECDHCSFRGTDYENVQIHIGTVHPEFCDEMDAGGLGKMIFYQKSAKLFHCHKCFFTSKMYSNVYYHITSKHAAPEKWNDKPENQLNKETDPLNSPSVPEHQKMPCNSAELKSIPLLSTETQKLGPVLSPESPTPAPLTPLELQKTDPVSPEPQAPSLPPEPLKPAPISSPELPKPAPAASESQKSVPSPEPQKPAPVSPEPVKAGLPNPKSQKHSHFTDTGGAPSASSPESPVLSASPEPWGPSPAASPESRKQPRTASPEPRKPSPSESPEPWKPFPAVSPEPRRPAPAVSPGSWKAGPPGSPRPWKSSPASSGPWKPTKPAPSVSPGPWKPIPSLSPGPWKPASSVSPASWKSSSVSPGSWKTPPTSPESWKSGPPELKKTTPTLSPEHWKAVPPVSPEIRKPGPPLSPELRSPAGSPELRKPSGSPDLWKLSPDHRKTSPASLDFSESQKSSRGGSPDLWKSSFIVESQKPTVFPETRKSGSSGPSESPKGASDIWKPVPSIDAEPRKSMLFPEPTKTAPPASPEPRKRVLFPEPRKHSLFSEFPKSTVFSESQKTAELGDELQIDAIGDPKCDILVQEELLVTPKKLLEDALFPSSKKIKKDSQEHSDAELSSSEYIRTDLDAIDIKGQESSSDQEQVDVESIDFGKESKMDMSSPEQSKHVLQFTEEKEAFISEEEIAKYMKRGKGKYYCKICCCRAMKKGAVLHHLVNKHNVHSPYKCTICGKAFLLESLLKNHVAAHGQSLLKCPRCNFESNFPRGFKKHLTHCQSRHNEETNKKLMEAFESPLEEQQL